MADGMDRTEEQLRSAVRDGITPGLVASVGIGEKVCGQWALGLANTEPGDRRPMDDQVVFDLASLTKVVATLPCILGLVADGSLALDSPVHSVVAGFAHPDITVRHLLTHTSGLPAGFGSETRVDSLADLVAAACREPLGSAPGTAVVYSDLGFILLGAMVELITGTGLEVAVAERVTTPLGLQARFRPPASWRARCAATEIVDGKAVVGRVHDENASAAGGVAGHAGLFGTVDDLSRYAIAWLDPSRLRLPADLHREALRCQTADTAGRRALGWASRGDGSDFLGAGWGPRAVTHTGFTGTSLALDPDSGVWAVLLTNAVHLGRERLGVRGMRERFHAAAARDLT